MIYAEGHKKPLMNSDWYIRAMEDLVEVVQDLSHAKDIQGVMNIVRRAARELTGADGATFILRDGNKCYYADEDAIGPLWKGQALEESNREIVSFAWAVAHDLRSPLRAIDNLAEWIGEYLRSGSQEAATDKVRTLKERVVRMESLLDSILEFSHLESRGGIKQDDLIKGEALARNIRALVNIPEEFNLVFEDGFQENLVPQVAFQRVLSNLVDNAIKHHDRKVGTVTVSAQTEASNYVLTVSDDGPGILYEYHHKVFEMFQTLKPRDTKEGSGMGLALVRKTLSAYGGHISVKSEGRGCVFRFTWPKISYRNDQRAG